MLSHKRRNPTSKLRHIILFFKHRSDGTGFIFHEMLLNTGKCESGEITQIFLTP